jgi:hypothetical protein
MVDYGISDDTPPDSPTVLYCNVDWSARVIFEKC